MWKKDSDYSDNAFSMFRSNPISKAPKRSFDQNEYWYGVVNEDKNAVTECVSNVISAKMTVFNRNIHVNTIPHHKAFIWIKDKRLCHHQWAICQLSDHKRNINQRVPQKCSKHWVSQADVRSRIINSFWSISPKAWF